MKADPHPEFTKVLLDAAHEAKIKVRYNAPYYTAMLLEQGGYETALQLISKPTPSEGFTHLWERKRLDLTAEAHTLLPEWCGLFEREILQAAYDRLSRIPVRVSRLVLAPSQPAGARANATVPPLSPMASDIAEPPRRIMTETYRILRDTAVTRRVKALHQWKCQVCGLVILLPDGTRYAEGHHVRPLGGDHDGPDREDNILCLCPNHHAELDLGVRPISLSALRLVAGHKVNPTYVEYHNTKLVKH